ncbi:hypothetical protein [Actinopolymorpha alba]|uniref:hypothetical protein n=1 Tax=Actinopolymorpha alba TaxID=533267 RepID=UPI00035F6521|nr:hypothetical protein [Actinopolymorpha alba]
MTRLGQGNAGRSRKVIESFAPTAGRVLGVLTMAIGALILGDVVVEWRTWNGLATAGIVVAVCTLIWLSLVRPSVVAYEDELVLRNILSDVHIPWHLVRSARIAPVLAIATEDASYRSAAVSVTGADRRAMRRSQRNAVESAQVGRPQSPGEADLGSRSPADYTTHRIETLAAQYAEKSKDKAQVVRTWRRVEFAIVGAAVLVTTVAALLG